MSGRYYVKKHRREKQTKERTPQFVVRRVHPGSGMISWQGRYYNLYRTFALEADCLGWVEALLNNDTSRITRDMVVVKHQIDRKHREIYVELKGIFEEDNTYFTEKYEGEWPSDAQIENFLQACFVRWLILFRRLNDGHTSKLLKRQQIGYRHEPDRFPHHAVA